MDKEYKQQILSALTLVLRLRDIGTSSLTELAYKGLCAFLGPYDTVIERANAYAYVANLAKQEFGEHTYDGHVFSTFRTLNPEKNEIDLAEMWLGFWIDWVVDYVVDHIDEDDFARLHPDIRAIWNVRQMQKKSGGQKQSLTDIEMDILAAVNLAEFLFDNTYTNPNHIAKKGLCRLLRGIPLRTDYDTCTDYILRILQGFYPDADENSYLYIMLQAADPQEKNGMIYNQWFDFWRNWVIRELVPRMSPYERDTLVASQIFVYVGSDARMKVR